MIRDWKRFLLERAAEWDAPNEGHWSALFHNNYHSHHSNINLLWFHDGSEFPQIATKVYRTPQIPQREFENLKWAHRLASTWVPRPLFCGMQGGFWTLWMEGVPGHRFWKFSPANLRSAVEMISSLHEAIRIGAQTPAPDRYRRIVSTPLATLAEFGPSASIRGGCAIVAANATARWIDSQAFIPQHGDLFVDNVLLHGDRWHVIDWESFGEVDFPFYDLVTLFVSALGAQGETPDMWDTSLLQQVPILVKHYADSLNLPPEDMRLLLPLTLANWFHLQWSDGRKAFTARMYRVIQHYFDHIDLWEKVFVPA